MTSLSELISRVEGAAGDIDHVTAAGLANDFSPWEANTECWSLLILALAGSVDAALSLIERKLPGAVWTLSAGHRVGGADGYDGFGAEVADFIQTADYPPAVSRAPALALILALLLALQAQGEQSNG